MSNSFRIFDGKNIWLVLKTVGIFVDDQIEKSEAWQTAIGLQAVDGLKTSAYLLDTAKDHIEGKISIDEAQKRIQSYYEQRTKYELKNRYMYVDYADDHSQSVNPKVPKSQFDTLEYTLEELAVLDLIYIKL